MTGSAPSHQPPEPALALASIDGPALAQAIEEIAPALMSLAPLVAWAVLQKSLAKLTSPNSSGAARTPDSVAADLERSGVGPLLDELGRSPQRLESLASVSRAAAQFNPLPGSVVVKGPAVPQPTLPERPTIRGDRLLARLAPIADTARAHQSAFLSLSQLSTTLPALGWQPGRVLSLAALPSASGAALPLIAGAASAQWPTWGVALTCLSGAVGMLKTNVGIDPARNFSADAVTRRLEAALSQPARPTVPTVDVASLSSLVTALAAIDLARRELGVNLLKPDWQPSLARVTASAKDAYAQFAALPAQTVPTPQLLQDASSVRAALAGLNRLDGLGVPLRSPDAVARLQGVMQPLEQMSATPVVRTLGAEAGDQRSLLMSLLRELARLYRGLMTPASLRR